MLTSTLLSVTTYFRSGRNVFTAITLVVISNRMRGPGENRWLMNRLVMVNL